MAWCPRCRTEYEDGYEVCSDCGAELVATPPPENADEPVVVFVGNSVSEAQVVAATLAAEGIDATVEPASSFVPNVEPFEDDTAEREVRVSPAEFERAIAVLKQPAASEAELTALADQSALPAEE